ncbi:MAG: PEP-utilizing enzyme [Anaerolineaceae bacterium]
MQPEYEEAPWAFNDSHLPKPEPPLVVALHEMADHVCRGVFTEAGVEPFPIFTGWQWAQGFQYVRSALPSPEGLRQLVLGYDRMREEYGGNIGIWERYCLPKTRSSCEFLAGAADDASLSEIAEAAEYGFLQTLLSANSLTGGFVIQGLLAPVYGAEAELKSFELTQGGSNATLDVDQEVWELADRVRQSEALRPLFEKLEGEELLAALESEPDGDSFMIAFRALIDRHASRAEGWSAMERTWGERPEAALGLIRNQVLNETPAPAVAMAASKRHSEVALVEVLAGVDPAIHAPLRGLVAQMEHYVEIREGRAYWQMVNRGRLREALLRQGERLVRAGAIDEAEDVFFLLPREVEEAQPGDHRAAATERRKEWKYWAAKEPPPEIGAAPVGPGLLGGPPVAADHERQIRGTAASRGTITAKARLLASPEDGDRLGPGEVLVCQMTTPAWTPLFSIAGAVVTETGAALSHPAIAAREYGIPCVVGARGALERIRDGQLITVDGLAGTVELLD